MMYFIAQHNDILTHELVCVGDQRASLHDDAQQ